MGSRMEPDRPVNLVLLGLDAAGKSAILNYLRHGECIMTEINERCQREEVEGKKGVAEGVSFVIWDVGGQERTRQLWSHFITNSEGVVFVVDSVDVDRMAEAKIELSKVEKDSEAAGVPILVVANKQDMPDALEPSTVESELASNIPVAAPGILPCVCGTSARTGEGLQEALESMYKLVLKSRAKSAEAVE